jgi:hypothetical protein
MRIAFDIGSDGLIDCLIVVACLVYGFIGLAIFRLQTIDEARQRLSRSGRHNGGGPFIAHLRWQPRHRKG